jgi:hypothetical protein
MASHLQGGIESGYSGKQNNRTMKTKNIISLTCASVLPLAILSCDSPEEKARKDALEQKADHLEEEADRIREQGEQRADAMERRVDDTAGSVREGTEQRADELEERADDVRDRK